MTLEEAIQKLQAVVEYYNTKTLTLHEVELRIYEFAAFIEPPQLTAMLPDSLRRELANMASRPLLRREEWSTIEAVCVRPERIEIYKKEKKLREDRQYEGICRLHKYFTEYGSSVALS